MNAPESWVHRTRTTNTTVDIFLTRVQQLLDLGTRAKELQLEVAAVGAMHKQGRVGRRKLYLSTNDDGEGLPSRQGSVLRHGGSPIFGLRAVDFARFSFQKAPEPSAGGALNKTQGAGWQGPAVSTTYHTGIWARARTSGWMAKVPCPNGGWDANSAI